MTRNEFVASHSVADLMEKRGAKLTGDGNARMCCCPLHEDGSPSFSIDLAQNVWFCHGGCGGGGVIDLIMKLDKIDYATFAKREGIESEGRARPSAWKGASAVLKRPESTAKAESAPLPKEIVATYWYHNALGNQMFQVVRYKPKDFRQRHMVNGSWVWSMEGVERLLYHLPDVLKSQTPILCEGEKDADNLIALGYCATTNVGGAKKWLDGYTESLVGKDVILCGDNDKAGQEHVNLVFESIAKRAKTVRILKLPEMFKDASEFIEAQPSKDVAKKILDDLIAEAVPHVGGVRLPVFKMSELEARYIRQAQNLQTVGLNLSQWLPSTRGQIRHLVAGELVLLIGDTGTGKTALLQNLIVHAEPLRTLFFEMELPHELVFERFVAIKSKLTCRTVEETYAAGVQCGESLGAEMLEQNFPHLFICCESGLTLDTLESYIVRSELKIGAKPQLVCVDYVQLFSGIGKRYERTSDAAEGLKVIAKRTGTIIIVASQVTRPGDNATITLHSGKDSGSLENSAGLVLGAERDPDDKRLIHLKVLKNTKGVGGWEILCNFDGETMRITERSKIDDRDIPAYPNSHPRSRGGNEE